ncbi:hypothetical protein PSU4_27920 [Pseudonocardia sulfidoxydans NBRC 16205]|uniref:4Fe-4S Wbl-type domain-containing protein n=1 Tax=Pseudonocardia sulfidoxydans NBRC 16205 TaxID=1223511 RepID=A0A511DL93_9PSEU|nr:hypothetical protein PSU4_27920 [Pseudonocardia sulfidoxydans NBRC 16205]
MTAAHEIARDWRADALCGQVDPELFFPTAERGAVFEAQVAAAKRICAGCPVRARCLDYALDALPDGVAGGLTAAERRAMRTAVGRGDPAAGLAELMPASGCQRERAAAGRAAAAAGMGPAELARRFRVSSGTAHRWRAEARRAHITNTSMSSTPSTGEGSPVAAGTPLRIFAAPHALAGNRALEGPEL